MCCSFRGLPSLISARKCVSLAAALKLVFCGIKASSFCFSLSCRTNVLRECKRLLVAALSERRLVHGSDK